MRATSEVARMVRVSLSCILAWMMFVDRIWEGKMIGI